jgi:regulation of enolase protein 1 (concanavalin A-like superfamily)
MTDATLHESFSGPSFSSRLRWTSAPEHWRIDQASKCLRINPDAGTDFWQRTHYGFEADNGHFLYLEASDDFVLTTKVTSHPIHQYDQAGLMVRVSPACWLKTSVEFEPDGLNRLGAVVTNAQLSDWSTQPQGSEHRVVSCTCGAQRLYR